jgi:hypothetical protein
MADCVAGRFKFRFESSVREGSHMPFHPGSERPRIAEHLSSFPDLQETCIPRTLREKRSTEILNVPWRYGKQGPSQVVKDRNLALLSHPPATSAAGASCSIVGDWGDIFYSPDSKARTGKHSDSRLRTGTRGPRLVTSRSPHSDVK